MRKTVTDVADDRGAEAVVVAAREVEEVEALAIGGGDAAGAQAEAAAGALAEAAAGVEVVIVIETGLLVAIAIVTARGGPTESLEEVTNL
mmetsp:Transcript_23318/g.49244  ORF Transcript_23318/g.49244 Transcript_23318/m.49244 type:complete len:90 (-) Transcript_23318:961-1230(-)